MGLSEAILFASKSNAFLSWIILDDVALWLNRVFKSFWCKSCCNICFDSFVLLCYMIQITSFWVVLIFFKNSKIWFYPHRKLKSPICPTLFPLHLSHSFLWPRRGNNGLGVFTFFRCFAFLLTFTYFAKKCKCKRFSKPNVQYNNFFNVGTPVGCILSLLLLITSHISGTY